MYSIIGNVIPQVGNVYASYLLLANLTTKSLILLMTCKAYTSALLGKEAPGSYHIHHMRDGISFLRQSLLSKKEVKRPMSGLD